MNVVAPRARHARAAAPVIGAAAVICGALAVACTPTTGRNTDVGGVTRQASAFRPGEWSAYGGDAGGTRYSSASQITRENVSRLRLAWSYRTGDLLTESRGRFQATPLMIDNTLFLATPLGSIIALDPVTGTERWRYSARVDLEGDYGDFANRGVSYWRDPSAPDAPCGRRIFYASVDARLHAIDAANGTACGGFGDGGVVDLTHGVRNSPEYKGEYGVTSPGAVVGDVIVIGSAISDNRRTDEPSGVVRAFDVRTGAVRWAWDPHPPAGVKGSETWQGPNAERTGAANAWSVFSVDAARGLVFVPTGSGSPDFYGGERLGSNLYANSLVALRAADGELVWHFQAVHHDLWDYDVPSQPVLFTLRRDGRSTPAVAQTTKMGHVFILDRETGAPLFPVEERPVPRSTVPGEEAWPTQPFPVLPKPLVPARLTADDAWGIDSVERAWCRDQLSGLRSEGIFTPPALEGTVLFPGNVGGSNWGSITIDTVRGILVAPTNRLATIITLVPRAEADARRPRGAEFGRQKGTPYAMLRTFLLSPKGLPCNPPPWGTLTAIDLSSGDVRWERPLGMMPQVAANPEGSKWGSIHVGGAMTTAGGLVFMGGSLDQKLRAYDIETGAELWSGDLPAAALATPMTYVGADGRQYVLIAAGGHDRLPVRRSDHLMAFALPAAGR